MKKLLGILVLGSGLILLSSCGYNYDNFKAEYSNYKYFAYACPVKSLNSGDTFNGCHFGASLNSQKEANSTALNGCRKNSSGCTMYKEGDYVVYNQQNYSNQQNSIKMASMIDKAKNTCKSLGFNEGTEKFTDCSLKLYTQEMELAAKQNQQVVIQGQNSGSMTIYDPVRDSENMMRRGMGLVNGTCTLANYYSC